MRPSLRCLRGLIGFVLLVGLWSSVATAITPLPAPGQSVTLLPDGRFLLLGGEGQGGSTAFVINRDGEAPMALPVGPRVPRGHHSATVLPDGKVLVFGGLKSNGAIVRDAEVFDPVAQSFAIIGDVGVVPRARHTATVLMDGSVLFAGGVSEQGDLLDRADRWDPVSRRALGASGRLIVPRADHETQWLADGTILVSGGSDRAGLLISSAELYLPDLQQFRLQDSASRKVNLAESANEAPSVRDTIPAQDAASVSIRTRMAIRFSKPLAAASLNVNTVTLLGPTGPVDITVVPVEGGRGLVVTPKTDLRPAARYTLFLNAAVDELGTALPFTAIGFSTESLAGAPIPVGTASATKAAVPVKAVLLGGSDPNVTMAQPTAASAGQGASPAVAFSKAGVWIPGTTHLRGNWQLKLPASSLQRLPALAAPAGVTALAGQILLMNGDGASGVTVSIGGESARTDTSGRFLVQGIGTGDKTLVIDGSSANKPGTTYGYFEVLVQLSAGKTSVLPYTSWMPRIDTVHTVKFDSPTTSEVVITTPYIPKLEVRLPKGTVLRDRKGRVINELSITPVPVDRPPFPLPNRYVPVYFTLQPGGAHLEGVDAASAQGARVIYPNYHHGAPGSVLDFWNYDPIERGWHIYGQGEIAADGMQIVPNPGVAIYELTGAMVSLPSNAPAEGPPPGGCGGSAGDPVDCYTGLFLHTRTDLAVAGTLPIEVTRTYRQRDNTSRAFGIGTNHLYDIFTVGDVSPYTYQDLILPDGGRIHFPRTSAGTGYVDAVYTHTATPTEYYGAQIAWVGGKWQLKMRDGRILYFYECELCSNSRGAALREYYDRLGNQLTLTRDTNANLTRIANSDGRYIDLSYDGANRVTQATDNIGRSVTYQYDVGGRLTQVTDPDGGVEQYTYDTANNLLTVRKPNGQLMVTNQYDANSRVSQQTLADGGIYQFAYTLDVNAKVTQTDITDPRGNVRRLSFNSSGYVTSATDALGMPEAQVTTYSRQSGTNLLTSMTDPLGRQTNYSYDSLGNLTGVTRLAGTAQSVLEAYTYDLTYSQVTSYTDGLGHTRTFRYDSVGNPVEVDDPLGNATRFAYNPAGKVTTVTDALGNVTTFSYRQGDLAGATDPLGRTVSFYTDGVGRLLSVADPLGNLTRFDYNGRSFPIRRTDAQGNATNLVYNGNGKLTSLTDARGGQTSFTYDAKDRLATKTDPLMQSESYTYDGLDNLVQLVDRKGKITTFGYDGLNRRVSAAFGQTLVGGIPSTPDATVNYTFDVGNRITQISDSAGGTLTRSYDGLDRLTEETTPQASVSYAYDAANRRTGFTVAGQTAVGYSYDNANRLTGITQGSAQVGFSYDAASRRSTLTLPNGVVATYGYDVASQLTSISYVSGGTALGNLTYVYDVAGRRTQQAGSLANLSLPVAIGSASYNAGNQLTNWGGASLTYDANGNLTGDGSLTYSWDSRNRLSALSGGATASFSYDGLSRRSSKTVSGVSTGYAYDGPNIVQELAGGSPRANLLTGLGLDEAFSRTDAVFGTRTFVTDALGSTLALTDGSGTVKTSYSYEPYGAATSSGEVSGNAFQYTGRENDGAGLYYYRARYYHPGFGRFVAEDPIGLAGGDNVYAYVGGSPSNFADPLGLQRGPVLLGLGNMYQSNVRPPALQMTPDPSTQSLWNDFGNAPNRAPQLPGEWSGINFPWKMPALNSYCESGYYGKPLDGLADNGPSDNSHGSCKPKSTPYSAVPIGYADPRGFTCTKWGIIGVTP